MEINSEDFPRGRQFSQQWQLEYPLEIIRRDQSGPARGTDANSTNEHGRARARAGNVSNDWSSRSSKRDRYSQLILSAENTFGKRCRSR